MRRYGPLAALAVWAILGTAAIRPALATTYDLPLNGSISITDNAAPGPIAIEVQATENFSLPVFDQQNPQTTVGVYQWIAAFSVFTQSGARVSEPLLSPFGTALTGYGQNCFVSPYCPHPSGSSSETVLSGTLFISGDSTLDTSTVISGTNIVSDNLQLFLTLPDDLTAELPGTPLPAAFPLFASGLALGGIFFGYRKRRKRLSAV
jgi:hypothetical protein